MKLTKKILAYSLSMAMILSSSCTQENLFDFTNEIGSSSKEAKRTTGSVTGSVVKITTTDPTRNIQIKEPQEGVEVSYCLSQLSNECINDPNDPTKSNVVTAKTNAKGQFFLNDIAIDSTGVLLKIENSKDFSDFDDDSPLELQAGRILDLGELELTPDDTGSGSGVPSSKQTVSGLIVDKTTGSPLVNVTVRDKISNELSTVTDSKGEFKLDVLANEVEFVSGAETRIFTVDAIRKQSRIQVDLSSNNRTLKGFVRDSSSPNITIPNVPVRIAGTNLAAISKEDGSYEIFGAPISSFTFETTQKVEGYSKAFAAVSNGDSGTIIEKDIQMDPIGSIIIHMTSQSAHFQPPSTCVLGYNCNHFDINGNGQADRVAEAGEFLYDNSLANRNALEGSISVSGTDINQKFSYPATPSEVVKDASGDDVIGRRFLGNFTVSIPLENIPGGKRTITVSLTAHQTQKSIPVHIPAKDKISTELITLRRAQPVDSLGDISGKILGVDADNLANVRVNFLDLNDNQAINALENQTNLLTEITNALTVTNGTAKPRTLNSDGTYQLLNVPSGSRIVVAGVVNADNTLSDCFIPAQSSLLNVVGGIANSVPDMDLVKRTNITGCN